MVECTACAAGSCDHGKRCPMMVRWYDDMWDGTFWRRCECTAWVAVKEFPVTVRRIDDPERPESQ